MNSKLYSKEFFQSCKKNVEPAGQVATIVKQFFSPKSIVDFGCGVGSWLKAFEECFEVNKILGLDGEWLKGNDLLISEDRIKYLNLAEEVNLEEKYDLVISVEVAEHIPERNSDQFISNLTSAGDVVLFSAAIPLQGGVNHINERWQSYWVEKFNAHDFLCIDIIRPFLWDTCPGIYAQNMFIYVKKNKLNNYPKLRDVLSTTIGKIDIVHPEIYEYKAKIYSEHTMVVWMKKELEGKGLAYQLINSGIKKIAIYGMGVFGKLLVKYFLNTNIQICYGIDKKQMEDFEGIKIYNLKDIDNLPEVDAVLVAVQYSLSEIYDNLQNKGFKKILNVEDVIKNS